MHPLFVHGAFSQSEANTVCSSIWGEDREEKGDDGGERERRWNELLPGVGCCHGVPSGTSIDARRAHLRLNGSGRAFFAVQKPKMALKYQASSLQECIEFDLFV